MKLWNDLTPWQRAVVGIIIVVAAVVLPEIAFLVQFGGMEIAFGLILVGLTPAINQCRRWYYAVKNAALLVCISLRGSASAKPSVFVLQAGFCVAAFAFTGSVVMAMGFFMPGLLFNSALL